MRFRAYKWTTDDLRAFQDGHQFKYGINEEDGKKDGRVCVSGGYHITNRTEGIWHGPNPLLHPSAHICRCNEVTYLKRDILGKQGDKLRVRRFRLLKKRPFSTVEYPRPVARSSSLYFDTSTANDSWYYRATTDTSSTSNTLGYYAF